VRGAPGATPLRTPRDSLAINTPYREGSVSETPREQKMRLKSARSTLEDAFAALPKPKNDFELVVPEDDEDEEADGYDSGIPLSAEDAAERDARLAARRAEEQRKALARRSQVIKLGLPRPVEFDPSSVLYDLQNAPEGSIEQELERTIAMELVRLLEHDSIVHPVAGGKLAGGGKSSLERIADEDLEAARAAVNSELAAALGFPGANEKIVKRTLAAQLDNEAFDAVWRATSESLAYDAASSSYVDRASLSASEIAQGQAELLSLYKKRMTADAAKAAKTENKLSKLLGGYQARNTALAAKLAAANESAREAVLQLDAFRTLALNEDAAIPRRLETLQKEVKDLERREKEGQIRYREMNQDKTGLQARLEELELEYAEAVNEQALEGMDES
jgi:pre-mRNA-splicing factor CDC5/CEF1